MKIFISTLVLCFAARAALAYKCDKGKVLVNKVVPADFPQGPWYLKNVKLSRSLKKKEGGIRNIMTSDGYSNKFAVEAYIKDGNTLVSVYKNDYFYDNYQILVWDPKMQYVITGVCPKASNDNKEPEPMIWIAFRSRYPTVEEVQAAVDAVLEVEPGLEEDDDESEARFVAFRNEYPSVEEVQAAVDAALEADLGKVEGDE